MTLESIVGDSAAVKNALEQVRIVAPAPSTVLICGESGTGKGLIARAIHDLSPRASKPFVKLNCTATPANSLGSELFGHEKGAFGGAIAKRIGRFELAGRGTLFLDEFSEIPLEMQTKLHRVLQEGEFERLGSPRTLRTDARLIAATTRDLEGMVSDHKFRSDLFYCLNVFPIHLPPLRERRADIPLLARRFVEQFSRRMNKTIHAIPAETMDALREYHWPGNICELRNVIERAVILSAGSVLWLPLSELRSASGNGIGKDDFSKEADRRKILAVLEETGWILGGKNGAAVRLGMKRPTLQVCIRKLGIARPGKRQFQDS